MLLRHIFLAAAAVVLTAGNVKAADVEAPPEVFNWSGLYVGASAGYAWSEADFDIDPTGAWEGGPAEVAFNNAMDVEIKPEGFIGGLKLGWNIQHDSLVFGLEADISYTDADDDVDNGPIIGSVLTSQSAAELSWLSTVRARAGVAFDRALIYATGGLALGDWEVEQSMLSGGVNASFEKSKWKLGWVIGGGIEYALDDAWSINAEYLYADFGKFTGDSEFPPPNSPNFTHDHKVDLTTQVVRASVSYRF